MGVQVNGLREFRQELRKVGGEFPGELANANFQVAEMVVQKARARALSVSAGARKSAESLSAARMQRIAAVRLGGARYPFAAGYEFGSIRYRQFPAWRGSDSDAGYFVYPTVRAQHDEILDTYSDLVADITRRAFPD